MYSVRVESVQYRPLQVGCQKNDVDLVVNLLTLRQHVVVILKNAAFRHILKFGDQMVFAIKTLNIGLQNWRPTYRSIQRIVAVTAQQILAR
jgi:hypothetical protein